MSDSLESLRRLSATLGRNPDLIQAGGGNTSLKIDGTLWVKASGKWLIHAEEEDMFLPVPMQEILGSIERGQEYTVASNGLRPSVETTLHAVLQQGCVVHVHSVNVLAWAALELSPQAFASRLDGLRWVWIPYIHPGLPLAQRIRDAVVSGSGGCSRSSESWSDRGCRYLRGRGTSSADVETRLGLSPRPLPDPGHDRLAELATDYWQIAPDEEVHALGTDLDAFEVATGGTLYPDHCVYLGHSLAGLHPGESPDHAAERYAARWGRRPPAIGCPEAGLLVSPELSRAGREMLVCLARVTRRIASSDEVHYLAYDDVARLMNWDAEHYRQSVARQMEER